MLATVVAQFTTKTTNAKEAIYFLSVMSYSTNKLKVYIIVPPVSTALFVRL